MGLFFVVFYNKFIMCSQFVHNQLLYCIHLEREVGQSYGVMFSLQHR